MNQKTPAGILTLCILNTRLYYQQSEPFIIIECLGKKYRSRLGPLKVEFSLKSLGTDLVSIKCFDDEDSFGDQLVGQGTFKASTLAHFEGDKKWISLHKNGEKTVDIYVETKFIITESQSRLTLPMLSKSRNAELSGSNVIKTKDNLIRRDLRQALELSSLGTSTSTYKIPDLSHYQQRELIEGALNDIQTSIFQREKQYSLESSSCMYQNDSTNVSKINAYKQAIT